MLRTYYEKAREELLKEICHLSSLCAEANVRLKEGSNILHLSNSIQETSSNISGLSTKMVELEKLMKEGYE